MLLIEELQIVALKGKSGIPVYVRNLLVENDNVFKLDEILQNQYVFKKQEVTIRGIRNDSITDNGLTLRLEGNIE